MVETTAPTPDQVEDEVMEELPGLKTAELLEICALIELEVDEQVRGTRKSILKLLMVHLCTPTADDDKLTAFLQIHKHLGLEKDGGEEESVLKVEQPNEVSSKKEEDASVRLEALEALVAKREKEQKMIAQVEDVQASARLEALEALVVKSEKQQKKMEQVEDVHTEIRKVKLKEFKIPGSAMIGGDGESSLSYNSLLFEVDKGRKLGYGDQEICAAIIPRVAEKETRVYFETTPDIELQDVLDMLKNVCCVAEGSTALFTQFTTDKQGKNEKPLVFITRVLRLRKRVHTVGIEEGVTYDQRMLAKRSFEVIFNGLRDESIRSALREKCKEDYDLGDKVIHKYASDIVAAEKERKDKLFGDKEAVADVNAVGTKEPLEIRQKKEKLNPFVEIDRLRADMQKETQEIKEMILAFKKEFKSLLQNKNSGNNDGGCQRKRIIRKCPQCVAENKDRCRHCWECGSDSHRRSDCPEN